jgi:hypothetical protein
MKKNHSPYFALVALFLASCSHQAAEHRDAVTTWIGRTLVIPQDQIAYTIATQPINCNLGHFDYKIISYIDSAGCVPCRMKLSEWLGHVNAGDTISATFALTNTDNTPYTLQALVPSCDCTFANADSDSLVPGGTMNITVTYVGDSISEPFKRHVDVYFLELQYPQRLIVYGFNN